MYCYMFMFVPDKILQIPTCHYYLSILIVSDKCDYFLFLFVHWQNFTDVIIHIIITWNPPRLLCRHTRQTFLEYFCLVLVPQGACCLGQSRTLPVGSGRGGGGFVFIILQYLHAQPSFICWHTQTFFDFFGCFCTLRYLWLPISKNLVMWVVRGLGGVFSSLYRIFM